MHLHKWRSSECKIFTILSVMYTCNIMQNVFSNPVIFVITSVSVFHALLLRELEIEILIITNLHLSISIAFMLILLVLL